MRDGIPVTLITDNMVGYVMYKGLVDKIIVGADRIVRDAVINKIGTYTVAVLAREHNIPFYVAAPLSTFDLNISAKDVIIEERDPKEVTQIKSIRIAPLGVNALNPAFDITPIEYVDAIICERGVLSREEFERLVSFLPQHAARIVTTAYYTGMRAGEIFGLTWDRVNLKEGFIDLEPEDTKTSEPRRIYLSPVLKDIFSQLSRVRHINHNFVFTYKGNPVKEIKSTFRSACKKAGIRDFRFHDLRHTFNTNMRKAGVDRSVIMKITGHKTMSMFERYNTVDKDDAQEAIKRLDEFLTKPSSKKVSTSILLQGSERENHPRVTP